MRSIDRRVAVAIAIPGAVCCVVAIAAFLGRIFRNELTSPEGAPTRTHYLQIGDAYTRGFVTGFFLCFFLMVLAVAIGSLFEQRRSRRSAVTEEIETSPLR